MCKLHTENGGRLQGILIIITLSLNFSICFSQNNTTGDTIIRIRPGTLIHTRDSIPFFSGDTLLKIPNSLVHSRINTTDRNIIFFDTLKARASKNYFIRKLYDLVVISPDTINNKLERTSESDYSNYSGRKIRNVDIQRLNVFGVDINNPSVRNRSRIDNLLNSTHVNTNDRIIRKNLLFATGDTISPLTLSDNERLLRQLPYIDDARIIVIPVSDSEADIVVLTKDVYSLGADFTYSGLKAGNISVFEKNVFGTGHEFGFDIPYNSALPESPGFGFHYTVDNIAKSFINLNTYYLTGLGQTTYGFDLSRKLVSSTTKYAGGISIRQMYTSEDLDTLTSPQPLKYNFQDYWISRSFMINRESVTRIIAGIRYTNNNVFNHPFILPDSYYNIQKYRIFLASLAFSVQKYYKTSLLYNYGRTEDVPYGALIKLTGGREFNEFKTRTYLGGEASLGQSVGNLGYFYTYAGIAAFLNGIRTEQGIFSFNLNYFSDLMSAGKNRIRNFVNINYTRGFDRNTDEFLSFYRTNGFSGIKNDTVTGERRLTISLESVVFSPLDIYNFKFAFFGFADFSVLSKGNELTGFPGSTLSSVGFGIRVRNDNLIFKTLQLRLAFYPNIPPYSEINHFTISGEQLLHPGNFDPGPPTVLPFR